MPLSGSVVAEEQKSLIPMVRHPKATRHASIKYIYFAFFFDQANYIERRSNKKDH